HRGVRHGTGRETVRVLDIDHADDAHPCPVAPTDLDLLPQRLTVGEEVKCEGIADDRYRRRRGDVAGTDPPAPQPGGAKRLDEPGTDRVNPAPAARLLLRRIADPALHAERRHPVRDAQ